MSGFDGAKGNPVTIRNYNNEHVEIGINSDAVCSNSMVQTYGNYSSPDRGHYVRFWGLDIHQPGAGIRESDVVPRQTPPDFSTNCVGPDGVGFQLINSWLHDCVGSVTGGSGLGFGDKLLYGNVSYNVGNVESDRGHGHSYYVQNQVDIGESGRSLVQDNVSWGAMGNAGIHSYGTSGTIGFITYDHNVEAGNGMNSSAEWTDSAYSILYGSDGSVNKPCNGVPGRDFSNKMAMSPILNGNMTYSPSGAAMVVGYNKGSCNATISNNYLASPSTSLGLSVGSAALCAAMGLVAPCGTYNTLTITGNTFMSTPNNSGGDGTGSATANRWTQANYPSNTYLPGFPASGKQFFYRPNRFEAGRGFVVVYNYDLSANLTIDLDQMGGYAGEKYQVHNMLAPNPYVHTPIATGTCGATCGTISVSATTATRAAPQGFRADGTTPMPTHPDMGPRFNVYILYPDWDATSPPNTPTFTPSFTRTSTGAATRTPGPTLPH